MSKKYTGKACAYICPGCQGVSKTADHVVAREFFLIRDRQNLPIVPACGNCNGLKSKLERYALTVLPLGSRHCQANAYSKANIERRLRRHPALRNRLVVHHSEIWERQSNGMLMPMMSLGIDAEQIQALFGLIVKGLFMFHWSEPLGEKWDPDVAIIRPDGERAVFSEILAKMGSNLEIVQDNLGRGTFQYVGVRGANLKWFSLWQLTVFGGLQFGNAGAPNQGFTKLFAVTRPDISRAPFTSEQAGLPTGAAA
jgi:hypothetical protein